MRLFVPLTPSASSVPDPKRPFHPGADLRSVAVPTDLPDRLFFGDRIDETFARTSDGFSIDYVDDAETWLQLRLTDGALRIEEWFLGQILGRSGGPPQLEWLVQRPIGLTGWQEVLDARLGALAPLRWETHALTDLVLCGMPDGHFVELVFTVAADDLTAVVAAYEDVWSRPVWPKPMALVVTDPALVFGEGVHLGLVTLRHLVRLAEALAPWIRDGVAGTIGSALARPLRTPGGRELDTPNLGGSWFELLRRYPSFREVRAIAEDPWPLRTFL